MEQETPTPPPAPNQGWSRAKSKTRHFPIFNCGERGLNFPFILLKIAASKLSIGGVARSQAISECEGRSQILSSSVATGRREPWERGWGKKGEPATKFSFPLWKQRETAKREKLSLDCEQSLFSQSSLSLATVACVTILRDCSQPKLSRKNLFLRSTRKKCRHSVNYAWRLVFAINVRCKTLRAYVHNNKMFTIEEGL